MNLPKGLPCLLLLFSLEGVAQTAGIQPTIAPVYSGDKSIVVKPVLPHDNERAEIETYGECASTNTGAAAIDQYAAIAIGQSVSKNHIGSVVVPLAKRLVEGDSVCVIEYVYAENDKKGRSALRSYVSQAKTATKSRAADAGLAVIPSLKPSIDQVYINDGAIVVMPVLPRDDERAEIETYRDCILTDNGVVAPDQYAAIAKTQPFLNNGVGPVVIQLEDKIEENGSVCVIEYIYAENDRNSEQVLRTLVSEVKTATKSRKVANIASFPSIRSDRTYARVTTGIDVSAAASADPAAHFMADLSFDVPFSNHNSSLYRTFSANGYLRLASIAQPGKINGIATPATYIKPLTDSTPNSLVQSWEGDVAFAKRLSPRLNLGEQDAYWTVSAILDGGFITPISADQTATTPVVYVANKAIYDFYTTAPVANALAAKAISDACVIPTSGPFPTCYVSYVPQDRTRFFRNYAAGITFKRYRYQGADNPRTSYFPGDDKFDFPGMATIKIGQNEYVTKGQAHGLVLHGDFFWPIHSVLKGNWTGPLYVFGQIDEHLSRNESSQQFILATAASTVQRTDANVAIIPVQQPDRDRYRFGIAVDLGTLLKAITPGRG